MKHAGIEFIWQDRKRYFGMPISFTRYALSETGCLPLWDF